MEHWQPCRGHMAEVMAFALPRLNTVVAEGVWIDSCTASWTKCFSNVGLVQLTLVVTVPCARQLFPVGEKKLVFLHLFWMCLSSPELRRPLAVCRPSLNVSPFLSSLRRKLRPLRIYNSLQDCSSTRGCQTIQMRHYSSPFSGTLQAAVFTVQSQRLTALGRLVGP